MQEQPSREMSCFSTSVINNFLFVEVSITKYLIFWQVIRVFQIFVNGVSMTNAKVYQGVPR